MQNDETRMTKCSFSQHRALFELRHSDLFRHSCFVIQISSRAFRRANCYTFFFKLRSQRARKVHRPWRIAVHANCLRPDIDIYSINGSNPTFAQHSQNTCGSFFGIVQQGIRPRARNQRPIAQIIAIGKNFGCDS